ncbi:MAG: methyltransferase domain-containing protein [Pseudomonadota bacterium]
MNTALKTRNDVQLAIAELHRLGLPLHNDPPKNWDGLGALREVLSHTDTDASVLDAGAESYSTMLPWLQLYGYTRLFGINLTFTEPWQLGPIRYEYGDLTNTKYPDHSFDAITCLSVIEHGVDVDSYFREMRRILKPGGLLVTSTDYFSSHTPADGLEAYGVPIKVFTEHELRDLVRSASRSGLELTGEIDFRCVDRAVTWSEVRLSYTFVVFAMQSPR